MSNENNKKDNKDDDVLMHFVIPYDWKRTLRGLFWINIGIIALYIFMVSISIITGILAFRPICVVIPILIFIAIYLLIRYTTVKYDKIKEPIRVWIKKDRFVYKTNYNFTGLFYNIKKVQVTINDKITKLQVWYTQKDKDGNIGWIYGLKRDNVEKGKYKEYIEKYWIPSMKLILERIKTYNPNVEISWSDTRKKYR